MKLIKISLIAFFALFSLVAKADLTDEDKLFFEEVMNSYGFDEYLSDPVILKSKEKLIEVENKIDKLKKITSFYQEPRIYFAVSRLYSIRGEMLRRHIIFKDRMDWFSIPVVQENLQGIRDNLTEVARLLEEGKGKPMGVGGSMSPVISLQLFDRFQRLNIKQNPHGLECNDPENHDCLPISYEELVLKKLLSIATEYQGYGYFEDADRLLNEIENFSAEGKAKVAELRPKYLEVRKTYVQDEETKQELSIMLPGGAPQPITIRGIDAIEENHKAALEAYNRAKATEASSSSSSIQSSAPASAAPTEPSPAPVEENNNRVILIGAGIVLLLLIGFVALRRRK
ncbi:MAG: hypothetical protein K0Q78_1092 [Cellvibrio sp.]|nr:hypothetical protein [Cellvibrio sp.]